MPLAIAATIVALVPQDAKPPKPLAENAVTEAWSSFLGPRRDGVSREAPIDAKFGDAGPPLVFEIPRGESMAAPAVAGDTLVHTHRVDGQVHVDCHDATTGERRWRHSFPCDYAGKYFDNGGPRATPTITGDRVVVHGVGGRLVVLKLESGEVVWDYDTTTEMEVGDDFFGVVSTPLVVGDLVVQNIGAPGGPSVCAFDLATGKKRWGAGTEWGPSCASPVLATLKGEPRILVLAGGESRPPTGGLMVVSPEGELTWEYPFRSRTTLSVNGASPVVCGDRVFLTAAYNTGAALVDIDAEGKGEAVWRERRSLALEFATPVFVDGLLFAIDGASGRSGAIVAVDPATGKEVARESLTFEQILGEGEKKRRVTASVGKGSILYADGHLWVLGDTGQLATIRYEDGEFETVSHAGLFYAPESWTPLALSRGLLYVCQNTRDLGDGGTPKLMCFDLRGTVSR